KAQLHSVTPFVEVQMVVTADNEHQTDDFEKMFARKGVQKVSLKSAQIYDFEKGSPLMPKNEKYSRYQLCDDGTFRLKGNCPNRCWKHWSSMVITSAGDMVPCCFDKNAAHAFGNIESGSLYKIWKSKAAQHFRTALLQHRKDIDICRNCSEV
ncbi:MAG: SPASM domain-containing protein, partial [Paludibacteraceae bacterium]|nr:SPASM domain-containing protein [Paludibacteraceae bacterium]